MTGAGIMTKRLRAIEAIRSVVPPERIKSGRLPAAVPLPALLVRNIGSVDRHPLKSAAWTRTDDRVRVTVRAASYRDQEKIMALLTFARADFIAEFDGAERISIHTAGRGPDLDGPGDSFEQAQDFRVSFDRPIS
jgi:hypothetical protein